MSNSILDIIVGLASIVAILDYFGIRPKESKWGLRMPLSRNWKLAIMLGLVTASLAMSAYGFYRSFKPKIVERIVEKPVEKIIEKLVPQECPKIEKDKSAVSHMPAIQQPVVIPPNTTIEATTNAPDSIAVGINTGTINLTPIPNLTWHIEDIAQGKNWKHPRAAAQFTLDHAMESAKFAVKCDHPCDPVSFDIKAGGYMQFDYKKIVGYPNYALVFVSGPNPMPPDVEAEVIVESEDESPVKILSVEKFQIKPK